MSLPSTRTSHSDVVVVVLKIIDTDITAGVDTDHVKVMISQRQNFTLNWEIQNVYIVRIDTASAFELPRILKNFI